ncbi:MAG: hypothetical protein A2033_17400 [Bacteroidetes bacterium GWA2_31_9]|nr:MAG: hypothetical protein A2033_17400 [Bacteroidetes bacterium GWA2_31_9]
MNHQLKKTIQFFVFLILGVVLLYFAFRDINLEKLIDAIINANYFWISLSILCALIALFFRAARWNMLIVPLGYKPSLLNSFYSLNLGYMANMAFPRIGEITRCAVLGKAEKIPVDSLIGTVILERIIDFITLVLLITITFFSKIKFFGDFFINEIFNPLFEKILNSTLLITIAFSCFAVFILGFFLLRKKISKNKFGIKITNFLKGMLEGLISLLKMKNKFRFFIYTIVIWLMYFLMTYLMFFSIDATSNLRPIDGLFILVAGGIGMTAPVQGGFGAFHWIVSLALMLYGISQEDGLIYATISHESQALFMLVLGAISFFMLFLGRRKLKHNDK